MMNKVILYTIVSLVFIVIVLLAPMLKENNAEQVQVVENVLPQQCTSLKTGCITSIDGMQVVLKFPEDIIYLNSFPIEVTISGSQPFQVQSVKLDFQMLKMNMGINYYQLQQDNRDTSLWKGKAVLPVCVSGRSDWQALLEVKTKYKVYKTVFQFEVKASNQ